MNSLFLIGTQFLFGESYLCKYRKTPNHFFPMLCCEAVVIHVSSSEYISRAHFNPTVVLLFYWNLQNNTISVFSYTITEPFLQSTESLTHAKFEGHQSWPMPPVAAPRYRHAISNILIRTLNLELTFCYHLGVLLPHGEDKKEPFLNNHRPLY